MIILIQNLKTNRSKWKVISSSTVNSQMPNSHIIFSKQPNLKWFSNATFFLSKKILTSLENSTETLVHNKYSFIME